MTLMISTPAVDSVAELIDRLGGIPPNRIRLRPAPGTATVRDVIELHDKTGRLFELVDGTLVEKAMGYAESAVASEINRRLGNFVHEHRLGLVTGEAGMLRLFASLVRIPDVAFASWDRLPGGRMPMEKVPLIAPELVVEVLSESNTRAEMELKRQEYHDAGILLVWEADPRTRTVDVYQGLAEPVRLTEADALVGGEVLPGFAVSVREIFAVLDARRPEGGGS